METKDAMKAVINASTARTATTLANTDLIQLYDNNGNPIYKISKSDFMSAVYNYLTSSSVASNLASVLGVLDFYKATEIGSVDTFNALADNGVFKFSDGQGYSGVPMDAPEGIQHGFVLCIKADRVNVWGQILFGFSNIKKYICVRMASYAAKSWTNWINLI